MREDDDMRVSGEDFRQLTFQIIRGLVAQCVELPQTLVCIQIAKFLDEEVVIELDLGTGVVSQAPIRPTVVTD